MKKRIFNTLSLLMASSLLTGCSTIMHGTNQKLCIASNPSSAAVWVDKQYMGSTPINVKLARNKQHIVSVQLDGYKPYEVVLEKNISAWVLGNVIFGGFIGVGVDAISGGIYKLTPKQIQAELCKEDIVYVEQNSDTYFAVLKNSRSDWEKIGQLERR